MTVGMAAGGAACGSGGAPAAVPVPDPEVAPSGPRAGDNYIVFYHEAGAIRRQDTRTNMESVVVPGVNEILVRRVAPGGGATAVAVRLGDSTAVLLLKGDGAARPLHRGTAETSYTMAWSTDGSRLGVGHRGGAAGGIVVAARDGSTGDMGCRASNRFAAWRSAQEAVVHDGTNFYAVSASGCQTRATFPMRGKTDMVYSADGRRVAFFRNRALNTTTGRQTIPELYGANYDGAGAQVLADYQSRAENVRWAPDASKVAFEVQSQQYLGLTHVAIYDYATGRAAFDSSPKTLGVPNDGNVCWSMDGARIAHDRTFARSTGGQTYTTRQKVVRVVATGAERVVSEELLSTPGAEMIDSDPNSCAWLDADRLLVDRTDGTAVVNVVTEDAFLIPPGRTVLLATFVPMV